MTDAVTGSEPAVSFRSSTPKVLSALLAVVVLPISIAFAIGQGQLWPLSLVVLPVGLMVRSWFVGAALHGDQLRVTSWFLTYKIELERGSQLRSELYSGFLNRYNPGGRRMNFNQYMLVYADASGNWIELPGMIGSRRNVQLFVRAFGTHASRLR